jgi:hypothetical protein
MGLLEDALRETFNSQVAALPGMDDPAGQAIRRAGAIRRRQVAVASVAVVVSVVLVGVGVLGNGSALTIPWAAGPAAPTTAAASITNPPAPLVGAKLPVDVLNGDRIQVADGRVISLAGLGTPQKALRVQPGWLVQTTNALPDPHAAQQSAVWLVDEKGFASQLAAGDATMVSGGTPTRPDPQVAWTSSGRLNLASLVGQGLSGTASTPGVDRLVPLMAVAGGVLLGGTQTGGGTDVWDMWYPDRGVYRSTPTSAPVSAVLGRTADGTHLYAIHGGKPGCLGNVEPPPQFTVTSSTCSLNLGLDDEIYPSPNGRSVLVLGATGYAVYDAATLFTNPQARTSGPLDGTGASGMWLTEETFAIYAKGMVVRVTEGAYESRYTVPDSFAPGGKGVIQDVR